MNRFLLACLLCCVDLCAKHTYGDLFVKSVKRVHDGDTFIVDIADVHPIIGDQISIRIKGIDTPEIADTRSDIKKIALQARDYLSARLQAAWSIQLKNIERDKYFRILADVYIDGTNIAEDLLNSGFAKPYNGKTKPDWDLP